MPKQISDLEKFSRNWPLLYRNQLFLSIIFGDLFLLGITLLPFILPMLVTAILFNHVLLNWLFVCVTLVLAWAMRPSFPIQGEAIDVDSAPRFFERLAVLKNKMGVTQRIHVLVDDAFNAGMASTHGLFGLIGVRHVMVLGLPLVQSLTEEELDAVIAHELGHLSKRHGFFGHWIYRARASWLEYSRYIDHSDAVLDRMCSSYAAWFVEYFERQSFVYSRQCEYEADALGADVVGKPLFTATLAKVALLSKAWDAYQRYSNDVSISQNIELNKVFYQNFVPYTQNISAEQLSAWRHDILQAKSAMFDTHPCVLDRASALGVTLPEPMLGGEATALLGEKADHLYEKLNQEWHQYHYLECLFKRNLTLLYPDISIVNATDLISTFQIKAALEIPFSDEESAWLGAQDSTVPEIQVIQHLLALQNFGSANIDAATAFATDYLPARLPIYEALNDWATETKHQDLTLFNARLVQAHLRNQRLIDDAYETHQFASCKPYEGVIPFKRVMAEVAEHDLCMKELALGVLSIGYTRKDGVKQPSHLYVLTLYIDPERHTQDYGFARSIKVRYKKFIKKLIEPTAIVYVHKRYTTETLPSQYAWSADEAFQLFKRE